MIKRSLESLKPLETFNKEVFVGNDEYTQDLCNFLLALSLIWNDTKNILLFYDYINSLKPKEKEINTPEDMPIMPIWGEISGIENYLEKSLVALIHELFSLIRSSTNVIESKCFKAIRKLLYKKSREAWDIIVSFASGQDDESTELSKVLLMVRHKIANHYDKNEIFKGYKRKFITGTYIPYISRGNKMLEERFYFADASAQDYYKSKQEDVKIGDFKDNLNLIRDSINFALHNIVEVFIQKRSAWKEVK
jgi:hypothetical protein